MKRVGILGRNGFLGNALSRYLTLFTEEFVEVEGKRSLFSNADDLDAFVQSCDVIVTFAGLNRLDDLNVVYQTNINIAKELVAALERTQVKPHVIYSSTIHEDRDEYYGKSKKEARILISEWAKSNNALFTGLVIPNVFGSFGKPFYNSVVATFCYQLANNETPKINVDGFLKLVYVDDVSKFIVSKIGEGKFDEKIEIPFEAELKVSEVLQKLEYFKSTYQEKGSIPELTSSLDIKLFNTFRNYINHATHFPVKLVQHTDDRGSFVEIIRLDVGGQVSFSTTKPGITRGNHFHTRKIERFAVIKGKALIQLRKIGTNEVLNFELNGDEPAYVDMPIWYTHNIKNIGDEVLYTNFWINEFFDPNDADTYFVEV